MDHGQKIIIRYNPKSQMISVRDYGRGIPLGKVIDCVSKINTGAKYNSDVFQFSVGLNGVGSKAVNALSSHFTVRSIREKRILWKLHLVEESSLTKIRERLMRRMAPTLILFQILKSSKNFIMMKSSFLSDFGTMLT